MKKEPTPPLSVSKESSVAVTKPVTTLASGTTEPEKPKSSITGSCISQRFIEVRYFYS